NNFSHQLEKRSTRQLYVDRQDRLWVWQGGQMRALDPQTGSLYFPAGFPALARRSNYVLNSADGSYWFRLNIIELGRKLIRYHPGTGEVATFPYDCDTRPLLPMAIDASGRVWMPCHNSQLALFKPGQASLEYIDLSEVFPERRTDLKIYALHYLPERDAFWAGTQYGLVYMKLREDGSLESRYYRREEKAEHNPLSDRILCLERAEDGKLWVGTRGGGFSLFDPATGHFTNYTTKDGLPNQVVYSIQKDKAGRLWISTNRGLSCYSPNEGRFRNFTARDGLQADEFNSMSYTKAPDGRLFFGGVNGINSFYPEEVQERMAAPNVMITGLEVNSEPLDFKEDTAIIQTPVPQVREIKLPHSQNVLTLRFAALQYANPSKHRYRYQMVGVDDQVKIVGGTREVTYANLQPGQYTFQVWGSSQGGRWSEQPATLRIRISPPWWRTTWAYIAYAILLGSALYFAYRFQVRRATLRNQLAYEQREAERLAELDRLKSDFFSNITHEFRTPLTLIHEPARQLLNKLSKAEERNMAYLISKNARQLLQLVNQLLDISKIEAGAMPVRYETGNLCTLVQDTGERFREHARQKGIKLEIDCQGEKSDYDSHFDKDKLEKIIANLLSNAVKFTPENGSIYLHCSRKDGHFIIVVEDTGMGIPESEQAHVFERFYQAKSADQKATGTGIGLALSKELTSILGGSLQLDSQVGRGSIFRLQIPAPSLEHATSAPASAQYTEQHQPAFGAEAAQNPPAEADSELKVLVVEDQPDLRRFICTVLGEHFQLMEAENGLEGLEVAVQELPDLVVSDVMMPIMDGFELTQRLKQDERTSHIPIVLLTAKSALKSRLEGFGRGADAYLEKPFYSEELLLRIQQLINLRKHLQKKYSQSQHTGNKSDLPDIETQFLEKLESCLEEHLSNPKLNAEELARMNHLSRSQLHRKLKAITGQSTTAFIRNYRLERGRAMLMEGFNVSEVSLKVGFNSPQYFSTRFKEQFGFSPSNLQDTPE
ncbi:MAG TPA: ATP-binding protein, partial [Phaeodactylibacter sp.]|nr:ATP-binding protein [Phaeodactylibacter sp.]